MKQFIFDLQLFAEGEDSGAPADNPADTGAGGAGDNAGSGENTDAKAGTGDEKAGKSGASTILGGAKAGTNADDPKADPAAEDAAYDFSTFVPEGMEYDEKEAAAFGAMAKEIGLTEEQAGKLAAYGMDYMQRGEQALEAARKAKIEAWGVQAKETLGASLEKEVSKAAIAMDRLETRIPGLKEMLEDTGAGNRIEAIRLLSAVGELLGEDPGHGGARSASTPNIYQNTDYNRY